MVRSFRGCRHALKASVWALTGAGARFDGLSRLDFRVTRFVVGLAPLATACLLRQANPAAKVSTSAVDAPSPRFSPKDIRNSRLLGCSSFRLFWVSLGTTQYPPRLSAVVVRSLRLPYIAGQPVRNSRKSKKMLSNRVGDTQIVASARQPANPEHGGIFLREIPLSRTLKGFTVRPSCA